MRNHVAEWGIKPRSCMWSAGAWKETKVLTRTSDKTKNKDKRSYVEYGIINIIAANPDIMLIHRNTFIFVNMF